LKSRKITRFSKDDENAPETLYFVVHWVCRAVSAQVMLQNPIKSPTLSAFLLDILDIVLTLAAPVIILSYIYVGFLFVKAQGDPNEIETAKKAFTYVSIGAAIVLGSTLLSEVVQTTIDNVRG
jgi:hypothetical protein